MKHFLKLLLILSACLNVSAAIVTGPVGDISGSAYNPQVEFWPQSTPLSSGSTNIVGPRKVIIPTNGNFAITLVAGRYLVKFPPTTNSVTIYVPNDTSTYSLVQLATNLSTVINVDASPAYKVKLTSTDTNPTVLAGKLVAGSGVTFTTNNASGSATLTIDASGGGGTSGAVTNNDTRALSFPGGVTATLTGSATASTWATNYDGMNPMHALNFRRGIRTTRTTGSFADLGQNSHFAVLGNPGTTGVVTRIVCVPDYANLIDLNTNKANVRFQVFANMGTSTNALASAFRVLDVPLSLLFGTKYKTGDYAVTRDSEWLYTDEDASVALNNSLPIRQFEWRVPIPFTNGIVARLTNSLWASNLNQAYIGATIEDTPLTAELVSYEFFSFTTNRAPMPGHSDDNDTNHICDILGSGYVAGMMLSFSNDVASDMNFMDSHGVEMITGSSATMTKYRPTGLDDMFGRTLVAARGEYIGRHKGVTSYNYDAGGGASWFEGYRWFYTDPICFTNRLRVYANGQAALRDFNILVFGYKRP